MGKRASGEHSVMTLEEAADYLRVHPSTIYRLLKKGELPAFKVGSDWRFNREHLDHWRLNASATVASIGAVNTEAIDFRKDSQHGAGAQK